MGVMQKFRNGTSFVLWLLIVSFGLIWVLSDVNFFDAISQGPRALGSVNGESITIEEYNSRIQYYVNTFSQQTGGSVTDEQRAFYESQAWEELVTAKLLEQKMDQLGITVTDQELLDMVLGPNPDPFIVQQFAGPDGTIDQAVLNQALAAEENSQIWVLIESQLRQNRRQQKLNNFITAGLQTTEAEIEELYMQENTLADVRFIRFPYADVAESEITVTDADVQQYYRENQKQFEREESYRFQYVSFSTLPNAADTARTIDNVSNLRERFAAAEDDSAFVVQNNSTTFYSSAFVAKEDIRDEFKPVLDVEEGEVTEVILTGGRVNIIKKVDENRNEVKFVVFSEDIVADQFDTINPKFDEADDFQFFADERNSIADEAEQRGFTTNSAFATKGNSFISGLGSSQQVLNFLEQGSVGDISSVYELQSEFVVVQMTEKTPKGVRPLDEVRPQIETFVRIEKRQQAAKDMAEGFMASASTLDALAEASGKEITDAPNQRMSATVLTGAGREPEVLGAVFTLQEGQLSQPIIGSNGVFVAALTNKRDADVSLLDIATRDQLRGQIEQRKNSAYLGVWLEQLKEEASITDNRSRLLTR